MRVLILESISGLRQKIEPRLFPEGFAMLRAMTNEFSEAGFDVTSTLNRGIRDFEDWLNVDELLHNDELDSAIKPKPDAALIIAPDAEGELEQITNKLREKRIPVLGAKGSSIRISRDKWKTHNTLKQKVPQPTTWKIPPNAGESLVAKQRQGAGCEGIHLTSNRIHSPSGGMIFQEFIEGVHASSCLLTKGGESSVLSVNKQMITQNNHFKYWGGEIPFENEQMEAQIEFSRKAAEALDLDGYCGVDFVIGDVPYFMELNPRITTSFVGLAPILQANLGELLINTLIEDNSPLKPRLRGCSIIKIPRVLRNVKLDVDKLKKLKQIPEIISPPFAPNGRLAKGSPLFLAVGCDSNSRKAERKLESKIKRAISSLGVDLNAVDWH
ncbi:hypothetical protein AKJ48_00835 [candidate division MSBL1 archaeon SCGC-AAA261O19]|uniref:ATP-grasp domain-containing protein n=1 Tax=candidate division MSBL1 archaeon SCGC-AAA261O19 TaxID=1698277 RepID=A0A133VEU4_9EURY|nr:hypothetical protein AKJ48_00835 [candidate division MSBL1 archaeon SCGC-AAA261O19]